MQLRVITIVILYRKLWVATFQRPACVYTVRPNSRKSNLYITVRGVWFDSCLVSRWSITENTFIVFGLDCKRHFIFLTVTDHWNLCVTERMPGSQCFLFDSWCCLFSSVWHFFGKACTINQQQNVHTAPQRP